MTFPTEWRTITGDYANDKDVMYLNKSDYRAWEFAWFDNNGNELDEKSLRYEDAKKFFSKDAARTAQALGRNLRYRQVKHVPTYQERRAAREEKKKHTQRHARVRIETFDINGELEDLTVESRELYKTTKGEHIKTRSSGNPYVTYYKDDDTAVIRYETRMGPWKVWSSKEQKYVLMERPRRVLVSSEEWNKRNDES